MNSTEKTARWAGCRVLLAAVGVLIYLSGATRAVPLPPTAPYAWKNVVVVGGGFVTGIIMHPKERGLMYARTDVGGAYHWNVPTKRWIPITDEFGPADWNFTGIESIAVDPTDANRVYAAVGTYTNDWAGNGAILRSNDRGTTWKRTLLPFKNGGNMDGRSAGERLAVDPTHPAHLFFGSRDNGLWESHDRGATWTQNMGFPVGGKTNGIGIVFIVFDAAAKTIYAGVSDKTIGLYRSDDTGATWQPIPNPSPLLPNHGVLDGAGNLYLSCGDAPGPNGMSDGAVWKRATKTGTWQEVTPEKPGLGNTFGYGGVTVDARHPQTVMVSTMDRWAKHDTLFRTTNGGTTWTNISPLAVRDSSLSPYLNWGRPKADLGHWIGDIEIDPFDSNHVLYVTGATIWASWDMTAADQNKPTHWQVGAKGVEETVPNTVVSPASGAPLLSAMGDIDGFRHISLDESPRSGFFQPSHGSCSDLDFAELNPQIVARVYGSGTCGAYSEDNGITWQEFAAKPAEKGNGQISVSSDGATFVWVPDGNVGAFVSRDHGATWQASTGLPTDTRRVVSDRERSNCFYAVSGGTLYASEDSSASFAARATGLPGGDYVRSVPGHSGDLWYCVEGKGLLHSRDAGAHFVLISGIAEAHRIGFGKPAPGHDYPAVFVAGKAKGVAGFFRSDDAGATWVRINDAQSGFHYVNAITGDPRVYGRVYLATGGRGILVGEPTIPHR